VHYQGDHYFVSVGVDGPTPGVDRSNLTDPYTLGGIYHLHFVDPAEPLFARAAITGMPATLNFRPHGLFFDKDSNRLFVVSHNEQKKEENIVIFTVNEDDEAAVSKSASKLPSLVFQVALYSDQWTPVGSNMDNWHLNDLVATDPEEEFLATQWGPFDAANLTTMKTLWSCALGLSYESVPEDGRVPTTCQPVEGVTSLGFNGITISNTWETVWVSDLPGFQILELHKNKTNASTGNNWFQTGSFPTPGLVDNFVYLDGALHMAAPLKIFPQSPADYVGSYLIGTRTDDDEETTFHVEPVFQLDPAFLAELEFPFVTSAAYPVTVDDANLLVFGAVGYPGILICPKQPQQQSDGEATSEDTDVPTASSGSNNAQSSSSSSSLVDAVASWILATAIALR